jgi:hypothetical protein
VQHVEPDVVARNADLAKAGRMTIRIPGGTHAPISIHAPTPLAHPSLLSRTLVAFLDR